MWDFKAKGVIYLYSLQQAFKYSIVKKYSVFCQGRKKPRSVYEWWSSQGVGIQAGLSLKEKTGCGRSSGSANTESALGASSAARSLLSTELFPGGCIISYHRRVKGSNSNTQEIVEIKTWLANMVLSSWAWFSLRGGMLWCCSTPFTALSLQYIFINKQVWIRLRDY